MFILLQLYIVNCKFVIIKKLAMFIMAISLHLSVYSQKVIAEDFYVSAFNEISDMLAGKDSLSIKRAVYVSEWAFYEGNLDYMSFCKEIDRIVAFVKLFYDTNKLSAFKTGKQMALNEYFLDLIQEMGTNLIFMISIVFLLIMKAGRPNSFLKFCKRIRGSVVLSLGCTKS